MKTIARLTALAVLVGALSACATSQDETWIGKNVGVCVGMDGAGASATAESTATTSSR